MATQNQTSTVQSAIANRINVLEKSGLLEVIKSVKASELYLPFLSDTNLNNPFPVFTCRAFDFGTKEYKAMLAFDCHFGAKSEDKEVAEYYENRFNYILSL